MFLEGGGKVCDNGVPSTVYVALGWWRGGHRTVGVVSAFAGPCVERDHGGCVCWPDR